MFFDIDTYFIGPVFCVGVNYLILHKSQHPWLINIREGWSNVAKLSAALYMAAPFIILPQSFTVAWLSYGAVHMFMREIGRRRKLHM